MILKKPLLFFSCLFLLLTPFSESIDLFCSHLFFQEESQSFSSFSLFQISYKYGNFPALILAAYFTGLCIHSYWKKKNLILFKASLCMTLTMGFACGFLINSVMKDTWNRPRPKQCLEFGGRFPYSSYYSINQAQDIPLRSFPSGHASMGFYFFCLLPFFQRTGKKRYLMPSAALATFCSALLCLTRVAQGGHFFTDVYAAGLIIFSTLYLMDFLIFHYFSSLDSLFDDEHCKK